MSKTAKSIGTVLALLLAVAGFAGWWVFGHLGQLVEQAIESHGPPITGTSVSLDGATISIFSGEGSLRGLDIGNPKGFSDEAAFQLGKIETAIDVASITGDVIKIRSIDIDGPRLIAEFDANGANNLKAILDHARSAAGGGGASKSSGSGKQQKLIIDEFNFVNAEVRVLAPAYKLDKSLKLGPIKLKGLGAKQGGAAAADIASQILRPVVDEAVRAATNEYLRTKRDELKDKATEKLLDKVFK
jgi:hypothetical protein